MVVHHTGSLHVGVANGGTEELETTFFHILADSVGDRCTGNHLACMVDDRLTVGHKAVQVFIERAEFLLYLDEKLRVIDSSQYFKAVTDNTGILHQALNIFVCELSDFLDVKIGESPAVTLPAAQDGDPA